MEFSKLNLNKDEIYLLSPFGLGDTAILCGLVDEISAKFDKKVNIVIKKSHQIVADIYNVTSVIAVDNFRYSIEDERLQNLVRNEKFPVPGKLFPAHFNFFERGLLLRNQDSNLYFGMLDYYKAMFYLGWDCKFKYPKKIGDSVYKNLVSTSHLEEKIGKIVGEFSFDSLVLVIPEASSFIVARKDYWNEIIKEYQRQGLTVITSVVDEKNRIKGIENISLTLNELILLCLLAKKVIAMRSGICDIVWQRGNDLVAVYPDLRTYYWGRIKSIFNESEVCEIVAE